MARQARVSQRLPAKPANSVAMRPVKSSKFSLENDISNLGRISSPTRLAKILRSAIDMAENGENRQRFVKQADECYSFFEGDQWINEDGSRSESPDWRYRMNRNVTFGMAQAKLALLMDLNSSPFWQADFPDAGDEATDFLAKFGLPPLPEDPNSKPLKTDQDLANELTDMLHAQSDARDDHTRMEGVYMDMIISGLGVEKTYWDWKRNRPGVMQVDPRDFLIDPKCTDRRLETAKYVVFRDRIDASEAQWRYKISPQKMSRIMEQAASREEVILRDRGGLLQRANYGSVFKDVNMSHTDNIRSMLDVYHLWFHEETMYGFEHDGEAPDKYPDGRAFTMIGEELVADEGNPYAKKSEKDGEPGGHGMAPYVLYRNYGNPRDPYGFGDIAPMRGNQIAINVLWSFMMQGVALTGNPQWLYEEGALRTEWLTNKPGLAIEVPRGMIDRVRRMEGMGVSQDFYSLINMLEENVEKQTNINPTLEGQSPGSHASGAGIQRLQDAALKRIRQNLRSADTGLRRRFVQMVCNVQQFYTFEEYLEVMGDGEWLNFDERMRFLKGDARVRSRADEPTTPQEKMAKAIELMNVGALDSLGLVNMAELDAEDDFREALEGRRRLEIKNNEFQEVTIELQTMQAQMQLDQMRQQMQQPPQLPGAMPPEPGGDGPPMGPPPEPGQEDLGLQPDPTAGTPPVEQAPMGEPQGAPQFA